VIPAPRPDHIVQGGDTLILGGPAAHILTLHSTPGLTVSPEHHFTIEDTKRELLELLISPRCPLVGRVVGDGSFRSHYGAAVIAVARHRERIAAVRLNDWRLEAGDVVLVETGSRFLQEHATSADFYLVTAKSAGPWVDGKSKSWLGAIVLTAMVGLAASGVLSMFEAVVAATLVLFATKCITLDLLRSSVDVRVLLTIAFAFGLGSAIGESGAARGFARAIAGAGTDDPWLALVVVVFGTSLLTETVTNNAAAALMVPIALATAEQLECSHLPFVVAVMVAASASFATPLGYQTNLMVYGPGGYRLGDFLRAGLVMNLTVALVTLALVPLIWPF
jgi:di/tricarboxylate transporter